MKKVTTVRELEKRKDLIFVDYDEEVSTIWEMLGQKAKDYSSFFVKIGDGDYDEVWGIENNVPYLDETAYRVK